MCTGREKAVGNEEKQAIKQRGVVESTVRGVHINK